MFHTRFHHTDYNMGLSPLQYIKTDDLAQDAAAAAKAAYFHLLVRQRYFLEVLPRRPNFHSRADPRESSTDYNILLGGNFGITKRGVSGGLAYLGRFAHK